jgi:hypothetical protein
VGVQKESAVFFRISFYIVGDRESRDISQNRTVLEISKYTAAEKTIGEMMEELEALNKR